MSCAKPPPIQLSLDNYFAGVDKADNIKLPDIKSINKYNVCVEFEQSIENKQYLFPISRKHGNPFDYFYLTSDLGERYNKGINCLSKNTVKVSLLQSELIWDTIFRQNSYEISFFLESKIKCKNSFVTLSSLGKQILVKHGKVIALGMVNQEDSTAVISATILLAFDKAINSLHEKITQTCQP